MLPQDFLNRMQTQLGGDFPAFLACFGAPPVRGLRVNLLRANPEDFLRISPWKLAPSGILPEGFVLSEEAAGVGKHPYHVAGAFYMQEPSAMAPVAAIPMQPNMRVLDLCAAPGGKSTAIAARMGGEGLLVSNELVPGRAKVLAQNIQRMGVTNAAVTSAKPDALCHALAGVFDAVLVDAPCSGEGMFRKDEEAVRAWSTEHVLACAARQKAILNSAAAAVKPGGTLVYSTCTFSKEENEGVIEDFLGNNRDFSLTGQTRLYPHACRGEGQFYAVLSRAGAAETPREAPRIQGSRAERALAREALAALFPALSFDNLSVLPDGRAFLLPADLPAGLYSLRMLLCGVEAGEVVKGRFEPAHALFQALGRDCAQTLSLSLDDARVAAFLHGETIPAADLSGFAAVLCSGFPLGFGKVSDGVLKNRLPKGLRVETR